MSRARPALALVGVGYWGPNLLRNAWELPDVDVVAICDRDSGALHQAARRYPAVRTTTSYDDVLEDDGIDAVILATPVHSHAAMARSALRAGKHTFIEKPMADTVSECDELIAMADHGGLVLMPGHTFLYSPPVRKVKRLLDDGVLGDLYFATFSRVNLGIHQSDASVIRDLGPHDISIVLYWFGEPEYVRAIGRDSVGSGQLDVAFIDMVMPNGALVHLELSWLAPTKLRRTVLVGSGKMIVYDDTSQEAVRVYDRGVEEIVPASFGEHQLSYRSGDVISPHLDADEPLGRELADFAHAIRDGEEPASTRRLGREVVRVIEATERSLELNAVTVSIASDGPPATNGEATKGKVSNGNVALYGTVGSPVA